MTGEHYERYAYNLLLAVLRTRDEVDCLHVTDVDLVPKNVCEDDLGDIFLLLIAIQVAVFEPLPDVCHLLVNPLLLQLADSRSSNVRDELREPTHIGRHLARFSRA